MNQLDSIEAVDTVYETGCRPLLVQESDLNFYVCKYHTSGSSADKLFREYIAASFAKECGICVPENSAVTLYKEYLLPDSEFVLSLSQLQFIWLFVPLPF
jgi:hypothetical protein